MLVCVTNESKRTVLAARAQVANSLWTRLRGLMGSSLLPEGEGLWLTPCTSVHSFFMRYPIDVLFLDARGTVITGGTLNPWRMTRWVRNAVGVLEIPKGMMDKTITRPGDKVTIKQI
jgi:uncharacterized membrane protein (UPF0127 family)